MFRSDMLRSDMFRNDMVRDDAMPCDIDRGREADRASVLPNVESAGEATHRASCAVLAAMAVAAVAHWSGGWPHPEVLIWLAAIPTGAAFGALKPDDAFAAEQEPSQENDRSVQGGDGANNEADAAPDGPPAGSSVTIGAPETFVPLSRMRPTGIDDPARLPIDQGWRIVVDAIPDPAIAISNRGLILHHNRAALDLFPSVRLGSLIWSFSRHPALRGAITDIAEGGGRRTVQIVERVPVARHIAATLSPLPAPADADGFPDILIVFRDLTDQDKLDEMRSDFVANASHELKTPLASLRGYIETLQGAARNDEAARDRFLGIMHQQALRMTRLIEDLLSLSRVEMRVHLPPSGVVELNDVANYVAQTLEPLVTSTRATLNVQRLARPARIRGDREEIVQALLNLVQNAHKYGGDGVRIDVKVGELPAFADGTHRFAIDVVDTGPGIGPEHLPRLVERFYRAPNPGNDKGGTGLGLAIVKHVVLRHRGELEITSTPGKGSCFRLVFDELSGSDPGEPGLKSKVV